MNETEVEKTEKKKTKRLTIKEGPHAGLPSVVKKIVAKEKKIRREKNKVARKSRVKNSRKRKAKYR